MMQRTVNLFLYDYVVCFYVMLMIFFFVWTILGSIWDNNEVFKYCHYHSHNNHPAMCSIMES